jgi:hypothetical protein
VPTRISATVAATASAAAGEGCTCGTSGISTRRVAMIGDAAHPLAPGGQVGQDGGDDAEAKRPSRPQVVSVMCSLSVPGRVWVRASTSVTNEPGRFPTTRHRQSRAPARNPSFCLQPGPSPRLGQADEPTGRRSRVGGAKCADDDDPAGRVAGCHAQRTAQTRYIHALHRASIFVRPNRLSDNNASDIDADQDVASIEA